VLVAGGFGADIDTVLASAELYDPSSWVFNATGSMTLPRAFSSATLLPNGKVLVAGGEAPVALRSAEVYDPTAGVFTVTGNLSVARAFHTATLLPNGKVLFAGGRDSSYNPLTTAELYE
jgi:hypothetical protein